MTTWLCIGCGHNAHDPGRCPPISLGVRVHPSLRYLTCRCTDGRSDVYPMPVVPWRGSAHPSDAETEERERTAG